MLVFEEPSVTAGEINGSVKLCVLVDNIMGTVETPFEVNITLMDGTAGKNNSNYIICTHHKNIIF